jgi:Tol biopolymer transport system component
VTDGVARSLGRRGGDPQVPATWSPDSTWLAYSSFFVPVDGSPPLVWTSGATTFGSASWSPDSTRFVYEDRQNGQYINGDPSHIATGQPDGSDRRVIADGAQSPQWSPTGDLIAVIDQGPTLPNGGRTYSVQTMRSDGTDRHTIVTHTGGPAPWAIRWSPDGRKLAVLVEPSYVMPNPEPPMHATC